MVTRRHIEDARDFRELTDLMYETGFQGYEDILTPNEVEEQVNEYLVDMARISSDWVDLYGMMRRVQEVTNSPGGYFEINDCYEIIELTQEDFESTKEDFLSYLEDNDLLDEEEGEVADGSLEEVVEINPDSCPKDPDDEYEFGKEDISLLDLFEM